MGFLEDKVGIVLGASEAGGMGHKIAVKLMSEGAKVIMLTALDDDDQRLVSFLRLCDGYLVKPLQKLELFEKLREIELINV